jgi:hypothetical protein
MSTLEGFWLSLWTLSFALYLRERSANEKLREENAELKRANEELKRTNVEMHVLGLDQPWIVG